jgi:uncharacterized damage-inducible protein DinB
MVTTIDLMDFVHELREAFFECAAGLGWEEFTKDRGVSMHSFRDVFLHLAYVEEQHVTQFCEGRPTPWMREVMRIPQRQFRSLASVRKRLRQVRAMGDVRFPRWNTAEELARPAVWVASRKYPIRLTRDAALAQCVTEHLLHLGEVEAMLWQMEVEPPTTFWIARRVLHGQWPPPKSALVGGRVLTRADLRRRSRRSADPARGTGRPRGGAGAAGRRRSGRTPPVSAGSMPGPGASPRRAGPTGSSPRRGAPAPVDGRRPGSVSRSLARPGSR